MTGEGRERWFVRSAATCAHGRRYTDAFLGDHPFSWTPLLCVPFCVHSPLQKLKMKSLPTIGWKTDLYSHPGKTLLNSHLKRLANPFESEAAAAAADPTIPLAERNICLQPGLTPRPAFIQPQGRATPQTGNDQGPSAPRGPGGSGLHLGWGWGLFSATVPERRG